MDDVDVLEVLVNLGFIFMGFMMGFVTTGLAKALFGGPGLVFMLFFGAFLGVSTALTGHNTFLFFGMLPGIIVSFLVFFR